MCSETVEAAAVTVGIYLMYTCLFVTCDLDVKAVYQSPHYSCESRLTFVVCAGIEYKAKLLANTQQESSMVRDWGLPGKAQERQIPQDTYLPNQTQSRAIPELVAVS